jgi:predicted metal-dependent hydrolase
MINFQDKVIEDPQLGAVLFRYNHRAKKYIIRIKPDAVTVTIPYRGNYKEAEAFFKKNRGLVLKKLEEAKVKTPPKQELSPQQEQELRLRAVAFFPNELKRLAREHGFKYTTVKIRKSRTRWGSCSSKGSINISLYLILLPSYLIEYVLLHELCHTVYMNHSPLFWNLLDKHTQGRSKELRKALRNYSPSLPLVDHLPGKFLLGL